MGSQDKIEPVVVETTTVEEKGVDETDIQIQKRRSSLKMRLSSVNSTPDKTRREMDLKEKTQILWMDPTEKDDQDKLAEKLDTDSQHKALNMSSQQQQTFDSMDLPENLTEVLEAQENNASSSKLKVQLTQ